MKWTVAQPGDRLRQARRRPTHRHGQAERATHLGHMPSPFPKHIVDGRDTIRRRLDLNIVHCVEEEEEEEEDVRAHGWAASTRNGGN
jgi:hypothetical protein